MPRPPKHQEQYEALKALNDGDDMDADAFGVVTGTDGEQTSWPRRVAFGGEVKDGDKILETQSSNFVALGEGKDTERQMPGYKKLQRGVAQEDEGERFEEVISGWCVLSAEKPEERDIQFEVIDGGVGDTWIRWKITSGDSGRGEQNDLVHIMVWGQ